MRAALLIGLVLLSACTSALETGNPPSNLERPETGTSPGIEEPATEVPIVDSGTPDAGSPATDAGSPLEDAGTPWPQEPSAAQPRWPALQTSIPTYELTLSQADYQALHDHAKDPPSRNFLVKGQFTHEGRTYAVELSFRGRSTKTDPRIVKKSWQVRFDTKARFEGR